MATHPGPVPFWAPGESRLTPSLSCVFWSLTTCRHLAAAHPSVKGRASWSMSHWLNRVSWNVRGEQKTVLRAGHWGVSGRAVQSGPCVSSPPAAAGALDVQAELGHLLPRDLRRWRGCEVCARVNTG